MYNFEIYIKFLVTNILCCEGDVAMNILSFFKPNLINLREFDKKINEAKKNKRLKRCLLFAANNTIQISKKTS